MAKSYNYVPSIGVKHYLNVKLKAKQAHLDGLEKSVYPLYVQVTFRGVTNRIKSVLSESIAEEDFDKFKKDNSDDLFIEELIIKRKVLELNPAESRYQKPIWTDYDYDNYSFELDKLVINELNNKVYDLLGQAIKDKMVGTEKLWRKAESEKVSLNSSLHKTTENLYPNSSNSLNFGFDISTIVFEPNQWFNIEKDETFSNNAALKPNFLSFFLSDYIPGFKELRDTYSPEFWDLYSYIQKIKADENRRLLIIDEVNTGEFDKSFMESWGDAKALESIHNGISILRESNSRLDEFFKKYKPYQVQ